MKTKPDEAIDVVAILQDDALMGSALRRAARQTIEEHKKEGRPLAMWRRGKVVWMPAEELQAEIAVRGSTPGSDGQQ